MKLGIYDIYANIPIEWYHAVHPPIIVSMTHNHKYWANVRVACPNAFIVGRHYFTEQPLDGQYWFDQMKDECRQMQDVYNAWMGPNELSCYNVPEATALLEQHNIWATLMRQMGWKTGAYSFPVGHPTDLRLWAILRKHLCDFLFVHEYDAPQMWREYDEAHGYGWLCLRYRQAEVPKDKLIAVIECGIDGGVEGIDRPVVGYRGFGGNDPEGNYAESLRWYDAKLVEDKCVIGAVPFAWQWDKGGGSFNIDNVPKVHAVIATPMPIPAPPISSGWYPFATKRPITISNFAVGRAGQKVKAVVLHIAEGAMANVFPLFNDPTRKVSTHFCIGKDGTIEQYVSVCDTAYGNGDVANPTWQDIIPGINPNFYTISIEHEGYFTDKWTAAMYDANNRLLVWLADQFSFTYIPYHTLIGHCEIDSVDKANCPGPNVEYDRIATDLAAITAAHKYAWMPINDQAALYKFAQANKLGYPQTDELELAFNNDKYLAQVFNLGIAYVKKGDWGNAKWVKKT